MRESQYINDYLDCTASKRYTVGTFLKYRLRGKAASYSLHYERALRKAIMRRVNDGSVVVVRSIKGGTSYARKCDVVGTLEPKAGTK